MKNDEELFTLADIKRVDVPDEAIYCIRVDSPNHEFLIGKNGVPTHNSDDAKAQQALKGEAQSMIGSIARLGRAAGVHLSIATQRPDAKLLPGELKANLGMRLACGNMNATASAMTLGSGSAVKTPGNPKGRAVISTYGHEQRLQVYFAPQEWIDGWLDRRGLNRDGTPKTTGPSAFIDRGLNGVTGGGNLDNLQGVDNSKYIARTRAEKERINAEHERKMAEQGISTDMPGLKAPETIASDGSNHQAQGYQEGVTREEDESYHIGRPELRGETGGNDRPEDAWDDSMDALQEAANDEPDDAAKIGVDESPAEPETSGDSSAGDGDSTDDDVIDLNDFTFADDDDSDDHEA
jgi:hypothetical protein